MRFFEQFIQLRILSLSHSVLRLWMLPHAQHQLLASALDDFYTAVDRPQASTALLSLWHHYFLKVIQPLLMSAGPKALEHLATARISEYVRKRLVDPESSLDVYGYLWRQLGRSAAFSVVALLYNRLPKQTLHGCVGGGVGAVLKAFIGNEMRDQPKGTELTAALIKFVVITSAFMKIKHWHYSSTLICTLRLIMTSSCTSLSVDRVIVE